MERLTPQQARDLLLSLPVKTDETQTASLSESLGRVLAQEVTARVPVPPFDRSAYDGYALQSADLQSASRDCPAVLSITEEIPAGAVPEADLKPGLAAKILTGAPIPKGADAVVKYEDTEFTDQQVRFFAPVRSGANIALLGEDIAAGARLAARGDLISPAHMGMLAGQGFKEVRVFRRPRIGLLCTGSELAAPGAPLLPGQIYNSNAHTLAGYLLGQGALPIDGGILADEPGEIVRALDRLLSENDMVVTTGGASVGDYDWALRALERLGAEILFNKCAMRPGGAMVAALKDGKLILSLSGNPGAAAIGLISVGLPYVRKLAGRTDVLPEEFDAVLLKTYPKKSPVARMLRGRLRIIDTLACFDQTEGEGNGLVSPLLGCDLIGQIPAGSPGLDAGERIRVIRI